MSSGTTTEGRETASPVEQLVRRDLRWIDAKTGEPVSVRESLRASCKRGMRHIDRSWWNKMAARIDTMTDAECDDALHEIERRCDAEIAEWQMYQ